MADTKEKRKFAADSITYYLKIIQRKEKPYYDDIRSQPFIRRSVQILDGGRTHRKNHTHRLAPEGGDRREDSAQRVYQHQPKHHLYVSHRLHRHHIGRKQGEETHPHRVAKNLAGDGDATLPTISCLAIQQQGEHDKGIGGQVRHPDHCRLLVGASRGRNRQACGLCPPPYLRLRRQRGEAGKAGSLYREPTTRQYHRADSFVKGQGEQQAGEGAERLRPEERLPGRQACAESR